MSKAGLATRRATRPHARALTNRLIKPAAAKAKASRSTSSK